MIWSLVNQGDGRTESLKMPNKLIWSWTLEDTKAVLKSHALPDWVERFVGLLIIGLMLYVATIYLAPITGIWIIFVAGIIATLGLYIEFKKKTPEVSAEKEAYLMIYDDGIKVNLDAFYGFYKLDDIILNSLEIKNIFHTYVTQLGLIKGLCFKTRKPRMTVKIPLVGMLTSKVNELENIVHEIKSDNSSIN